MSLFFLLQMTGVRSLGILLSLDLVSFRAFLMFSSWFSTTFSTAATRHISWWRMEESEPEATHLDNKWIAEEQMPEETFNIIHYSKITHNMSF